MEAFFIFINSTSTPTVVASNFHTRVGTYEMEKEQTLHRRLPKITEGSDNLDTFEVRL